MPHPKHLKHTNSFLSHSSLPGGSNPHFYMRKLRHRWLSLNYGHMTDAGATRLQNQVSLYFLNKALAMQILRPQGASEPPGRLQKTQVSDSISLNEPRNEFLTHCRDPELVQGPYFENHSIRTLNPRLQVCTMWEIFITTNI